MTGPHETVQITRADVTLLRLMAHGYTQAEAADRLYVCATTVEDRLRRLRTKLGVNTTIQAIVWAAHKGFV